MPSSRGKSPWWYGTGLLILFIVMVGLVGTLLAGPAPPLVRTSAEVNISLSGQMWGVLFLTPLIVGFAGYVIRWVLESNAGLPMRVATSVALAAIVALLLSSLVLHANASGGALFPTGTSEGAGATGSQGVGNGTSGNGGNSTNGTGGAGGNSTNGTGASGGNSSGYPNGTAGGRGGHGGRGGSGSNGTGNASGSGSGYGANNTTGSLPGARPATGISVRISNWVALAAAGVLGAMAAILVLPGTLSRLLDRPGRSRPGGGTAAGPAQLRTALVEAKVAIEAGESPRGTIVRLYDRLLQEVAPAVEDVASSTAEEIQKTLLIRFRVPEGRSEVLTQMFEEARYSTHPIASDAADRYVQTMQAVEHDLFLGGSVR